MEAAHPPFGHRPILALTVGDPAGIGPEIASRALNDARVREQAHRDGMRPLRVSGAVKVATGLTTAEEVMKVAPLG